jgi:hypothetical protein
MATLTELSVSSLPAALFSSLEVRPETSPAGSLWE